MAGTRRCSPFHADHLARRQVALVKRAAGVDERPAVALEPLHDEALAAEQADAELALKGDADATPLWPRPGTNPSARSARRRSRRDGWDDLSRIGRPEGDLLLPLLLFRNTVMNSDSPVSSRLPAPISAPMKPACCCCDPSPKMVSISMPSSMYIIPPASATVASPDRARPRRTACRRRRSCIRFRASLPCLILCESSRAGWRKPAPTYA